MQPHIARASFAESAGNLAYHAIALAQQMDYLRSTGEDDLLADLLLRYGDGVPADRQSAAERPRCWLDSMAAASENTWRVGVAGVRQSVVVSITGPGRRLIELLSD